MEGSLTASSAKHSKEIKKGDITEASKPLYSESCIRVEIMSAYSQPESSPLEELNAHLLNE